MSTDFSAFITLGNKKCAGLLYHEDRNHPETLRIHDMVTGEGIDFPCATHATIESIKESLDRLKVFLPEK